MWNQFRHKIGGQGCSQKRISQLYKKYKRGDDMRIYKCKGKYLVWDGKVLVELDTLSPNQRRRSLSLNRDVKGTLANKGSIRSSVESKRTSFKGKSPRQMTPQNMMSYKRESLPKRLIIRDPSDQLEEIKIPSPQKRTSGSRKSSSHIDTFSPESFNKFLRLSKTPSPKRSGSHKRSSSFERSSSSTKRRSSPKKKSVSPVQSKRKSVSPKRRSLKRDSKTPPSLQYYTHPPEKLQDIIDDVYEKRRPVDWFIDLEKRSFFEKNPKKPYDVTKNIVSDQLLPQYMIKQGYNVTWDKNAVRQKYNDVVDVMGDTDEEALWYAQYL